MKLGAEWEANGGCAFTVWAPRAERVDVKITAPDARVIPMERTGRGYWYANAGGVPPGARYLYVLDGALERPDPASHYQPGDVHSPSAVVDHSAYRWKAAAWSGRDIRDYVIYELHVGTFTPEGTFRAVIPQLAELSELGITALEIMPAAQFPGGRNWGYDGVYLYAVQNTYGAPDDLKALVDACHGLGIAVALDAVYNHLGPEGNYLRDFGPYFTGKYRTPWGEAVNFDDEHSDEVRKFFLDNAAYWFETYCVDALRLDAVHAICDMGAEHFLRSLAERAEECSRRQGRKLYLIAESDLNDSRIIRPPGQGGYGLDAQWSDDFHHALHALLTGEDYGYYRDFGGPGPLARALRDAYVYDGGYSRFRARSHGNPARDLPAEKFVVFSQNHDQVGNRMLGERLASLVSFEARKLSAGLVILSPYIPLIFMGEEYGEDNPFLYFVSHSDPGLVESVRKGRREEFREFHARGDAPDPQAPETFERSRLDHGKKTRGRHKFLLAFTTRLLRLRRETPALARPDRTGLEVSLIREDRVLLMARGREGERVLAVFNLGPEPLTVTLPDMAGPGTRRVLFDSASPEWGGPGRPEAGELRAGGDLTLGAWGFAVMGG